jgi:hypothetical protein
VSAESIDFSNAGSGAASDQNWDYDYRLNTTAVAVAFLITTQPNETVTVECSPSTLPGGTDLWSDRFLAFPMTLIALQAG